MKKYEDIKDQEGFEKKFFEALRWIDEPTEIEKAARQPMRYRVHPGLSQH